MQKTRQRIIEYLKRHGQATVDELSEALDHLTAVTVRHHLNVLRREGLVAPPEIQHRRTPGRPKYVYRLTEKAEALFPHNVSTLTGHLLSEVKNLLDAQQIDVLFEAIAERMAESIPPGPEGEPMDARLERLVAYLNEQGYEAHWEPHPEGFVLYTSNCPYRGVSEEHEELCTMDMHYISRALGKIPRRLEHLMEGSFSCAYLIEATQPETV